MYAHCALHSDKLTVASYLSMNTNGSVAIIFAIKITCHVTREVLLQNIRYGIAHICAGHIVPITICETRKREKVNKKSSKTLCCPKRTNGS